MLRLARFFWLRRHFDFAERCLFIPLAAVSKRLCHDSYTRVDEWPLPYEERPELGLNFRRLFPSRAMEIA